MVAWIHTTFGYLENIRNYQECRNHVIRVAWKIIMGSSRVPGPLSEDKLTGPVKDGTSALTPSPKPGPIGMHAPAAASAAVPATAAATKPDKDAEIEALDLAPKARKAAYALKKAHPSVKFTSGRRSKEDQARAMASNVVKNRKWIEQTYAGSTVRAKCQKWLDDNPDKKTQAEIQEGLLSVLNTATDAQLGYLSKHLSGDAFDVQPVEEDAEAIKKTLRDLVKPHGRFLDTEGGLVRWHAQF